MKKLLCTALLCTLLISCHATARLYPVQGPLADSDMAPLWDSVYGSGFYVAHVLGTRLYARASLAGKTGDSLKVEFYRPEGGGNSEAVPIQGSVRGVAKDGKGNVYKVTFS